MCLERARASNYPGRIPSAGGLLCSKGLLSSLQEGFRIDWALPG